MDLVISGLPAEMRAEDLKKLVSAKHVVEAGVEHDTIRNVCTGTGRLRVRLGDGENIDQVTL